MGELKKYDGAISTEIEKSVTGDTYGIANFTTKSALPLEKCKVGFEFSQDLNGYSKPWAGGAGKNLYDAEKYNWFYLWCEK